MMDILLHIGLSNACITLALAIVAMGVGVSINRPQLTHLLWLLVFVTYEGDALSSSSK